MKEEKGFKTVFSMPECMKKKTSYQVHEIEIKCLNYTRSVQIDKIRLHFIFIGFQKRIKAIRKRLKHLKCGAVH